MLWDSTNCPPMDDPVKRLQEAHRRMVRPFQGKAMQKLAVDLYFEEVEQFCRRFCVIPPGGEQWDNRRRKERA